MSKWPPDYSELEPDERLEAVQAQISKRIKDFDIQALVDLLLELGYALDMLEFRGHPTLSPQPTLLHAIEFPQRDASFDTPPRVRITVNLGLLSCRSPLPSYFLRLLEDVESHYQLIELLRMLDCSLLHRRLTCDRATWIVPEWQQACKDVLHSAGLSSPIGLQWLCQQVFPELGVLVRRVGNTREVDMIGARLDGYSKLGECSFGKRTRVGVHELELVLICEDASYDEVRPWIYVGKQRLRDHVFPLLDEICVTLTVSFVLLDRGTRARLSAAPPSYMGYDPMWADDNLPADPPARILLYRGTLPLDAPDADALERVLAEDTGATVELSERELQLEGLAFGCMCPLALTYRAPGQQYVYTAVVDWGVRAWYRDEPRVIWLRVGDQADLETSIPKPPVDPEQHLRLWTKLRDEARRRLGASVAALVRDGGPVTAALIQRLGALRNYEALHALAATDITPHEDWDEAAYRAFSNLRGG